MYIHNTVPSVKPKDPIEQLCPVILTVDDPVVLDPRNPAIPADPVDPGNPVLPPTSNEPTIDGIREKIRNGNIDAAIDDLNKIGATGIVRTNNKNNGKLVSVTLEFTYQGQRYEETYTISNDSDDNNNGTTQDIFDGLDRNSTFRSYQWGRISNTAGTSGVEERKKSLKDDARQHLLDAENALKPYVLNIIGWNFEADYHNFFRSIVNNFINGYNFNFQVTQENAITVTVSYDCKAFYDAFLAKLQEETIKHEKVGGSRNTEGDKGADETDDIDKTGETSGDTGTDEPEEPAGSQSVWEVMDLKDIPGYNNNKEVKIRIKDIADPGEALYSIQKEAKDFLSKYKSNYKDYVCNKLGADFGAEYSAFYDSVLNEFIRGYQFETKTVVPYKYYVYKTKDLVDGFLTKLDEAIQAKKQ